MAVPKKKTTFTKKNIRFNVWKNKKIIFNNYLYCEKCWFIKRSGYACNNCYSFK